MLPTVMGAARVWPVSKLVLGFDSDTLLKVTLVLNGWLGPALYMSLPWMRSYMVPKPPRRMVLLLPVTSYAKPRRGPNAAQWSWTKPLGIPFWPAMPRPFR